MPEIIACCGLKCHECPALLARRGDDHFLRKKTAAEWSKMYDSSIAPDQIDCDGCPPGGEVHFGHCAECRIRACALERGLENCSSCPEYACQSLLSFFEWVPEARLTLDSMRGRTDG